MKITPSVFLLEDSLTLVDPSPLQTTSVPILISAWLGYINTTGDLLCKENTVLTNMSHTCNLRPFSKFKKQVKYIFIHIYYIYIFIEASKWKTVEM